MAIVERNVPTLQTASQGEVVVPIAEDAALVFATYHDEELQPWMGLVGE